VVSEPLTPERIERLRISVERMEKRGAENPADYGPVQIWPDALGALLDSEARLREMDVELAGAQRIAAHAMLDMEKAQAENERLREFVIAHTLVEQGVTDFELHAEAVERFRRAAADVEDVIRDALG
jgi:hypothetical protein